MIYISSACSKQNNIKLAVKELVEIGFKNIELTGGTQFYDEYEKDLLELKSKHGLNYLIHNYFPPPENPFILNLASLNEKIYKKSIHHLRKALSLSRTLEADKFGFHAGFFVDRPVSEIGKKFGKSNLSDKRKAVQNFTKGFGLLREEFREIDFFIENNCYSESNYRVYGNDIPFMLLNFHDYRALKKKLISTCFLILGI